MAAIYTGFSTLTPSATKELTSESMVFTLYAKVKSIVFKIFNFLKSFFIQSENETKTSILLTYSNV
jgi:hypothetical protein